MTNRLLLGAVALTLLTGCGARMGYRWSYRDPQATGLYGGPAINVAWSLAERTKSAGGAPYLDLHAAYHFAPGPDFGLIGGGLIGTSRPVHNHVMYGLVLDLEFMHGIGVNIGACTGYGNWGLAAACGRWSSKGNLSGDITLSFPSAVRLAAAVHQSARDSDGSSGRDWDFD